MAAQREMFDLIDGLLGERLFPDTDKVVTPADKHVQQPPQIRPKANDHTEAGFEFDFISLILDTSGPDGPA